MTTFNDPRNPLVEISTIFDFRDRAAITIPKVLREKAVRLSVDIVVRSIARSSYKNYKMEPAEDFYGYATLVFRNSDYLSIPIRQPRQRIFSERIDAALLSYDALLKAGDEQNALALINRNVIAVGVALGLTINELPIACPEWRGFIETELNEIYIKLSEGTQFSVEINHSVIPDVTIGDCVYAIKSGKPDTDKDEGLPSGGSQPFMAPNPSNPFDGLPFTRPLTPISPFYNGKDSTNNEDPDNAPPASLGRFAKVRYDTRTGEPACRACFVEEYFLIGDGETISLRLDSSSIQCGVNSGVYTLIRSSSGGSIGRVFADVGGVTISYVSGYSLPPNASNCA